jgi:hypothetical protein
MGHACALDGVTECCETDSTMRNLFCGVVVFVWLVGVGRCAAVTEASVLVMNCSPHALSLNWMVGSGADSNFPVVLQPGGTRVCFVRSTSWPVVVLWEYFDEVTFDYVCDYESGFTLWGPFAYEVSMADSWKGGGAVLQQLSTAPWVVMAPSGASVPVPVETLWVAFMAGFGFVVMPFMIWAVVRLAKAGLQLDGA